MQKIKLTAVDYAVIAVLLMYSSSATVTPICFVNMRQEFGLSLSAGGGIETMRSMLIFFSLFLSGFAAAKFGKVLSMFWGALVLSLGFACFASAPNYAFILGATVFIGAGAGILEGLLNPLVQDAHPKDSGRYMNITNAFWSVGVFCTVLFGGYFLTGGLSWRVIMWFLAIASAFAAFFMRSVKKSEPKCAEVSTKQVIEQYISCTKSKRFWVFCVMIALGGGAEGAFTFWSASYIQINFNADPLMGGIGTAFFAAGMMVMRFAGGILIKQKYLRRLILSSSIAGTFVALTVPFIQSPVLFFAVLFVAGLTVACYWPSIQSYAVDRLCLDPTAVFILLSCAGIPGFGLTALAMGIAADYAGFSNSFFIIPIMLSFLSVIVLIERSFPPAPVKKF